MSKALILFLIISPLLFSNFINQSFSLLDDMIYPIDSTIEGKSYGEWAIQFWKWWISLPANYDKNSEFTYNSKTLDKCFMGEDFPVIFLVNPMITFYLDEKKKVYDCTIPDNKPIFVLGISELCNYNSPKESNPTEVLKTDKDLEDCVHTRNPYADVELIIDGRAIGKEETDKFRLTTDFFNITIPKGSAHEGSGIGTNRALLDGTFLILKPLPPGDHVIQQKTVQIIPHNPADNLFLEVIYNMHVK